MSTHLVTKSRFDLTAAAVASGRALLDSHADTPWSGVHGAVTLVVQDYSNSNSELVASLVTVYEKDGLKYYVPAKDASSAAADADPVSGPVDAVSVWRHEDATGAPRLDSVSGRHMAVTGTITRAAGKCGYCSQLDGSSRLSVKCDNELAFKGRNFTLTCWVKPGTLVDGAVVLAKALNNSQVEVALRTKLDVADYVFSVEAGGVELDSTTVLSAGTWYFVSLSFERATNTLRLAVNNVAVSRFAVMVEEPLSPQLTCGGYGDGTSPFTGFIDSTRFFTRALTSADLAILYGSGSGVAPVSVPGNTDGVHSNEPTVTRDVPKQQHLVSDDLDFDQVTGAVEATTQAIRAHVAQVFPSVHGGFDVLNRATRDSAGYLVGRYLLSTRVGGVTVGLVADTRPDGPPKLVKLASQCPTALFTGQSEVSCSMVGCRFRIISDGGGKGEKFPTEIELTFNLTSGTGSIKYIWQWSEDGINWKDVSLPNGAVTRGAGIVPLQDAYGNWGHIGEIQATPAALFKTLWRSQSPGGDRGAGWSMRCKFDNTHVGGGVTYSGVMDCYLQDHSDSVCCTYAFSQGAIDMETYVADLRHGATLDPQVKRGYHRWAKPLVRLAKRSPLARWVTLKMTQAWCRHVAYQSGLVTVPSASGRWLNCVGQRVCRWLGR